MRTAVTQSKVWHIQLMRVASALLATGTLFAVSEAHSLDLNLSHKLSTPGKNDNTFKKTGGVAPIRAGKEVAKLKEYSAAPSQDIKQRPSTKLLPVVNPEDNTSHAKSGGSLPQGFSYKAGQLGFQYKMDESTRVVVGSLQDKQVQFAPRNSGVHLVKRVDGDKSFFLGVKRTHGDADETTSQFGFLYDLN